MPKWVLNMTASYMAGAEIEDLNSGMRIFSRNLCYYLWGLFPTGFSFTSTLTMGAVLGGFRVKNYPVNYYQRIGESSIQPLKDTLRFFLLIFRLGLLFAPMKIFGPVGAILLIIGAGRGFLRDYFVVGYIGNLAVITMLAAVQILMMGLLAELIVHSRRLKR